MWNKELWTSNFMVISTNLLDHQICDFINAGKKRVDYGKLNFQNFETRQLTGAFHSQWYELFYCLKKYTRKIPWSIPFKFFNFSTRFEYFKLEFLIGCERIFFEINFDWLRKICIFTHWIHSQVSHTYRCDSTFFRRTMKL